MSAPRSPLPAAPVARPSGRDPSSLRTCCSTLYGHPLAELVIGESLHPGGLETTRRLLRAASLPVGARLLDVGCGLGASARMAASDFGLRVDAVDPSIEVIAQAEVREPRGRVRWHQASALDLPFPAATFEGILAECTLSIVARGPALAELRRVVRPGGRLLISDVEVGGNPIPGLEDHALLGAALCVTDAWRTGEMDTALVAAGFRIDRRWDMTPSILTLLDRVETRLALAAIAARDLGLDLSGLAGPHAGGAPTLPSRDDVHRLAEAIRAAVRQGDLRYAGVVSTATGRRGPGNPDRVQRR